MLDEPSRPAAGPQPLPARRPRPLPAPGSGMPPDAAAGAHPLHGPPPTRMRQQLTAATAAGKLAARLLAAPRAERLAMIAADADGAYRRDSLALLLALAAEERLEAAPPVAEEYAEAALAVAIAMPPAGAADVRHLQTIAAWLLAKAQLRLGRLDAAEATFRRARRAAAAVRDQALVVAGQAQLRWQQGFTDDAVALLTAAGWVYSNLQDRDAVAACRAQAGFLLLGRRDLALARIALAAAHRDLGRDASPSLGVLVALGLAHCEAALRNTAVPATRNTAAPATRHTAAPVTADLLALARDSAARARPAPGRVLGRWWDALLDPRAAGRWRPLVPSAPAPRQPLAGAELGHALRSTLDQALGRIATGHGSSVAGLAAALATASPDHGPPWAEDIAALPALAASRPDAYAAAARDLALRLAARDIADLAAGNLPWGLCHLADRLLRQRPESEDPIAAQGDRHGRC
jgi:hypothetical protein